MKKALLLLLCLVSLFCLPILAEDDPQARADSGYVGVWVETDGFGTLTVRVDGTSTMIYYDNTVTECTWGLTETGAKFLDGQWLNSPMVLENEYTLNVANGWMIFVREDMYDPDAYEYVTEELNPVPVGEEGDPYFGTWRLTSIEADGVSMDPSLLGMQMELVFDPAGLVTSYDGEDEFTEVWSVEYGFAMIEGMPLSIDNEGRLIMKDEGAEMIFVRSEGEEAPEETELSEEEELLALLALLAMMEEESLANLPEELQGFVGEWHLCYVATGGLTGDLRSIGVTGMLVLDANGFGSLSGLADETGDWYDDEGIVRFGESGMPLFLIGDEEDGMGLFLQYGSELGGYMIFHQDPEATWVPGLYPLAALPTPAAPDTPEAGDATVTGSLLLDAKYLCTSYTTAGFTMAASTLGAEYSVIFHANGTVDFTLSGIGFPAIPCSVTDGVYVIDYYGTPFTCVPTAEGFDMDYYGAMLMHFTPAE